MTNGSGYVVYEVLDASSTVQENAQFPTFVGTATTGVAAGTANEFISFAPISTDATANASAPVPRFIATQPPSDCQTIGDCGASYFPSMAIFAQSIVFTAIQGGLALQPPGYIAVQNTNASQSLLNWVASIKYQNGSDWLTLENPFGLNNGSIRVWAQPQKLAPGTYSAVGHHRRWTRRDQVGSGDAGGHCPAASDSDAHADSGRRRFRSTRRA